MAGLGGRFDLEEARREALAEKKARRMRAIASNVTFGVVVVVLLVGGKIGWDKWQEARERAREEAAAAQALVEREAAARKAKEAAEAKAAAEKREAERNAKEAAREAERKAKEAKREAERKAKEEEKRRKEEEKRLAEINRVEQEHLHKYIDASVAELRFQTGDHLACGYGIDDLIETSVDEERWLELNSLVKNKRTIEFLYKLRGENVTNVFSDVFYPNQETFAKLIDNLENERFTLVIHLTDKVRDRRLALVAPDPEEGLAPPEGARAVKNGSRVTGWMVPFAYGDKMPIFLVEQATAAQFAREWKARVRKLNADAAKLDNRDEYVAERLKKMLPDFVRTFRVEIETPPPPPETAKRPDRKDDGKKRPALKGSNKSSIRTMSGPQRIR
ncbi:MAG: hypothetical protein IJ829_05405 [Kiritimatiellae bacterium]|nr:hypothetical protein [Kiritimatiellia bacterium]